MIVEWLIILIFGLSLYKRRLEVFIFSATTLAQNMFLTGLQGAAYFDAEIRLDILIIIMIDIFCRDSKLARFLKTVSWISIVVNCAGWVTWPGEASRIIYNIIAVVLYSWTVVAIIKDNEFDRSCDG